MAMIRAAVHAFPGFACDPAEMVRYLNRHFEFLWESPMFATALVALVDPRDRSVTLACAGHPPPLLMSGGRVRPLPVNATMPVLMMDLRSVPEVRHVLDAGDRLLFYTDGVTERHDPQDDMYDLPRLEASFERTSGLSPDDQVTSIVRDLDAFGGDREPDDDQTLLLMAID
jgi:sigma-B regulation protein RsbU (phosphoserine phosphatase)